MGTPKEGKICRKVKWPAIIGAGYFLLIAILEQAGVPLSASITSAAQLLIGAIVGHQITRSEDLNPSP